MKTKGKGKLNEIMKHFLKLKRENREAGYPVNKLLVGWATRYSEDNFP